MQTTAKLSVPEVVALLISVSAMRAAGNFPFSELADAGLAKIDKVLPSDKVKDLRAFLDCLHIGQLSPLHDISDMGEMAPELLFALETAFIQRQLICFNDHDSRGQKTQRDIGNLLLMAAKNSRRGTPESPIFHLPPHQERSALRHVWIWQK
jgi:predicted DNA-binding transcriptional regulator YafY